jgi:hypothetical protein
MTKLTAPFGLLLGAAVWLLLFMQATSACAAAAMHTRSRTTAGAMRVRTATPASRVA